MVKAGGYPPGDAEISVSFGPAVRVLCGGESARDGRFSLSRQSPWKDHLNSLL